MEIHQFLWLVRFKSGNFTESCDEKEKKLFRSVVLYENLMRIYSRFTITSF